MPNELRIIHVCEDEKFINSAIEQFEYCFPGINSFYVLPISKDGKFIHVKSKSFVVKISNEELLTISLNLKTKYIVILHSLTPRFFDFVLHLPKSIIVIWFCFGFEVYSDQNYFKSKNLLDRITFQKFPGKDPSIKQKLKEQIRPFYRLIKPSLPFSYKEIKHKVFKRVNFFCCPFLEEYQSICKLIGITKPFFNFWYYPIELIADIDRSIKFPKTNLMVGNSGFKSLNHLDVFYKINNYPLANMDIIVPLNYGEPKYIQEVLLVGENDFSDKFKPLLDFMTLKDYNKILESVGVAILNNRRQQAVGNSIALLWFGAKLFLSNKNPFYSYLKRIGIYVFCYETELTAKNCTEFLSLDEIEHNRKTLFKELNKVHLSNLLKEQILKLNA
ncbi:TDP-N-acetylfucosamine:lipid II N-acetylfucosaminyltransferase [Fontibacter flavus]|uniref:TDP-N-acetylfucosamine:lipid II N-acetylfucosaminyltransferase n=1 Tax=Fontibacter flavus TaxID=654838 RepID=A0ABV6FUG1_9BACT